MSHLDSSSSSPLYFAPLRRRLWACLLVGAVLVFALCYLTSPNLFGTIDWVRIHVFYKRYAAEAVRHGRLPLWNPYISLGRPFLADVDAATLFYPLNLPYLFFAPELACVLVGSAHLALAGYGALRLSEALGADRALGAAAACVFVLSAPIVGSFHSGLVHYGPALCYLPLVFAMMIALQDRSDDGRTPRRLVALGAVLGLQLLAGHPQAAWLTWLGVGLFSLARRPHWKALLALVAAVVIALLLAAITLLPLAELTTQSNRGRPSLELAGAFAMPSYAWASLLVPSDPAYSFLANAQLYLGIAPLLLAVLAIARGSDRNVRGFAIVAAFSAVLAAGTSTPLFRLLFAVVPGVSTLRLHSRASVLVVLALVFLAVIALTKPRPQPRRALMMLGVLTILVAAAQLAFVLSWPGFAEDRALRIAIRLGITLGSGLAIAWCLRAPGRVAHVVLCAIVAGDLAWSVVGLKPQNRDLGDRPTETEIHDELLRAGRYDPSGVPPRVSVPRPFARENAGMKEGWSSYTGYAALSLDRVWNHVHVMRGLEVPTQQNTYVDRRVFQLEAFPFHSMSLTLGVDPKTRAGVMQDPDPRAYVVNAAVRVADHREATRRMAAGHDFHSVALVETALELPTAATSATGSAIIERFAPERIVVHATSTSAGLLVLGEAYYPGWTATVNGVATPCLPANAWMRAVPIPAGDSTVVLEFRSRYLLAGALVSILSWLVVLVLLRAGRISPRARTNRG